MNFVSFFNMKIFSLTPATIVFGLLFFVGCVIKGQTTECDCIDPEETTEEGGNSTNPVHSGGGGGSFQTDDGGAGGVEHSEQSCDPVSQHCSCESDLNCGDGTGLEQTCNLSDGFCYYSCETIEDCKRHADQFQTCSVEGLCLTD